MLIAIDGNEANFDKKVGIHQMAFEILWELYKLEDSKKSNRYIIYLKNKPNPDLPKANSNWQYKVIAGNRLWIITKLMPELYRGPTADIFLTLSHYLPMFAPMPMVCFITDLGYLEFTAQFKKYDYWQLKWWTAISLIVSKYIIAISETTKKDIVRRYPFTEKKISVAYLAGNRQLFEKKKTLNESKKILNSYGIHKKYILFVSTLKPSKNIEGLVEAFSELRKRHDYQLVIAGKKGWLYETIFEKVKSLKIENDVVFTDYLPEEDKPSIISGAKFLVLPSFWEGFGIDVLNAYSCGVPVAVSNIPVLREVAGDAGVYFDPTNIGTIVTAMEKIISLDTKEYNSLVEKGREISKKFTWGRTAKDILQVLEKVDNNK